MGMLSHGMRVTDTVMDLCVIAADAKYWTRMTIR